jgi:hypothetical protein
MFQFPRFPPARTQVPGITQGGCPIRTSPDRRLPAPPQSISSRGHVLHRPVAPRHPPCAHLWIILFIGSWPSSRLPRIMVFVVRAMTSVITRVLAPLSGGASSVCNVHQSWWSRGDSNPGPPPCKGGALPAKLRPHASIARSRPPSVGAPGLEPGTSALSGPRSNQLSYAPVGHDWSNQHQAFPGAEDGAVSGLPLHLHRCVCAMPTRLSTIDWRSCQAATDSRPRLPRSLVPTRSLHRSWLDRRDNP